MPVADPDMPEGVEAGEATATWNVALMEAEAEADASYWAAFRAGGCPRCGGPLAAYSPAGHGRAACDNCQTYWG